MATADTSYIDQLEEDSMARTRPDSHADKATPPREKPLFLRLPPAYHEALAGLARKGRRTLTAEAMIALEEHFAKNGIDLRPPD